MPAVSSPTIDSGSHVLWRTWFDNGLRAIDRRDFSEAISWLREAERHVSGDDRRCAITQANRAYALFRRAQEYLSHAEHLKSQWQECPTPECFTCIPLCPPRDVSGLSEETARSIAHELRSKAKAEVESALPRLGFDAQQSHLNLASARGSYVSGEFHRDAGRKNLALQRFEVALSYYRWLPLQDEETDAVLVRIFDLAYRVRNFSRATLALDQLELRVSSRSGQNLWIAKLLVCRADVLLQLGEYRQAAALYPRWHRLQGGCRQGTDTGRDCGYACSIFGRALLTVGNLDEAGRLLELGALIAPGLPHRDRFLDFDLAVSRAELALRRAEFDESRSWLQRAPGYAPFDAARQVRLCLLRGRLELALGRVVMARPCFEEALRIAEMEGDGRVILLVASLLGLARLDCLQGRWESSVEHTRRALACLEAEPARVRAEFAWTIHQLAMSYQQDDRFEESGPLCELAMRQLAMSLGAAHPDLVEMLLTTAEFQWPLGRFNLALAACEQAHSLIRQHAPHDGFAFGRIFSTWAQVLHASGDLSAAKHFYELAIDAWTNAEMRVFSEHCEKSLIMLGLATLLAGEQTLSSAEQTFVELSPLLLQLKGTASRVAYELNRRANLFKRRRRYDEALWLYARAFDAYSRELGPAHPFSVQIQKNVEQTLKEKETALSMTVFPVEPALEGWGEIVPLQLPALPILIAPPAPEERVDDANLQEAIPIQRREKDLIPTKESEEPVTGPRFPPAPFPTHP